MNVRSIALNTGSIAINAAKSVASEAALFGNHLCRLVNRNETLGTRALVITEIAGLALAVYGAVLIGLGIAACATGVGVPAGAWLIAHGGFNLATGGDTYKMASNAIKHKLTLNSLRSPIGLYWLYRGTLYGKVLSLFRSCSERFQRP